MEAARYLGSAQSFASVQHDARTHGQLLAGRPRPNQTFELGALFFGQVDLWRPRTRHASPLASQDA
jgi:hypothetical protein